MTRITDRLAADATVLGAYAGFASDREIWALAEAGLDFIRLDGWKHAWDDTTIARLVRVCGEAGVTAWARCRAADIHRWLDVGVGAVTVPSVDSAGQAAQIASDAHGRDDDVLIGCQVETAAGLSELEAIVATDGIDMIHSGRTDLAAALGAPDQFAPVVLEAESRIAAAASAAGKYVALMYPLTEIGFQHVQSWRARGVRLFALDLDSAVLTRAYREALQQLAGDDRKDA